MAQGSISINHQTYRKLKKQYNKAVIQKKATFMFEGNELLVDYAKYLLQYMEMQLGIRK